MAKGSSRLAAARGLTDRQTDRERQRVRARARERVFMCVCLRERERERERERHREKGKRGGGLLFNAIQQKRARVLCE